MATTPYEIPLTPVPQRFAIDLDGGSYNLTVYWNNAPQGGWLLDIADSNGVPLVNSIPLVTGIDLLMQYQYLGINGSLEVQSDTDLFAVPNFTNLGSTAHLYFITSEGT